MSTLNRNRKLSIGCPECKEPFLSRYRVWCGDVPAFKEYLTEMSDAHRDVAEVETRFTRIEPQFGRSLKPRPLRIIGTHLSARVALVFACFALET